MKFEEFAGLLHGRLKSRVDRAVMFSTFLVFGKDSSEVSLKAIEGAFGAAHLPAPNVTVLKEILRRDRRVSVNGDKVRPLKPARDALHETFPEILMGADNDESLSGDVAAAISDTPLIDRAYIDDLHHMMSCYAAVHALENSMRRLISNVLQRKFGADWWEAAANESQKKKHVTRLDNETKRKWLPARSSMGPLYSLDWADLIALMRRFESEFLPYIGEVDFLHRFADLGLIRHVIAHNGFIDDTVHFQQITVALRDWQRQIGAKLKEL